MHDHPTHPQSTSQRRLILPSPIGKIGTGELDNEAELLAQLGPGTTMMMGDNPVLPPMPEKPGLMDFYTQRFGLVTYRHLLNSAKLALEAGQPEIVVIACLLHDISNGALIRVDHGYWSAQLIAPYVSEEVAWAVRYHQALRYFPDSSVGYEYPQAYHRFFGEGFVPPEYIRKDHDEARRHRWYMTSRLVTIYDVYSFDTNVDVNPDLFADIIGRHFKTPREGLGFDGSPVAHMWRSMIWPNNFL